MGWVGGILEGGQLSDETSGASSMGYKLMPTHDDPRTTETLLPRPARIFIRNHTHTHITLPRSLAHLTARWLRGSAASNRSSRGHTYTMLADASSSFASCFDRRRRLLLLRRLYRYWLLHCCYCYLLLLRRQRQHHLNPSVADRWTLSCFRRLARTPLRTDNVDPKTLWACCGSRIDGSVDWQGPVYREGIPPTT